MEKNSVTLKKFE